MIRDARQIGETSRFDGDVAIVGCGPAGIALARRLSDAGVSAVVVESGGSVRRPDADRLGAGESVGESYYPLARTRVRGVGGTSLHWQNFRRGDDFWNARPLDSVDFDNPSGDAATYTNGWPFDDRELRPFYVDAQAVCGLGPFAYETQAWTDRNTQLLDTTRLRTIVFQQGEGDFSVYAPDLERRRNVLVLMNATATALIHDEAGRVSEITASTTSGRRMAVRARVFVLAAGGVENARLLMLTTARFPKGLGNAYGLVGRYFMEKLTTRAAVWVPSNDGALGSLDFYRTHTVNGTRVRGALSIAAGEGLPRAAIWLDARRAYETSPAGTSAAVLFRALSRRPMPRHLGRHARNVAVGVADLVRIGSSRVLRRPWPGRSVVLLGIQAEQRPNRDSRVTLGSRRDLFGQRVARVDWRITSADTAGIRRTIDIVDEEFRSRGLGTVIRKIGDAAYPPLYLGSFHHIGTTRMGADATHGVVDADGLVLESPNLYVTGSSVFPTSGCANPTLTIVALALRLGDHLTRRLARPELQEPLRRPPGPMPAGPQRHGP